MNRRAFLQRFGIGLAAAAALASVPVSALEALSITEAGRRCAIEFLRKRYNEYVRGRSSDAMPLSMRVPPGLFAAYEGELTVCERFIPNEDARGEYAPRGLMFKGTALFADETMPAAWDVRFQERPAPGREYAWNTTGAIFA